MKIKNTELVNTLLWAWVNPNLLVDGFLVVWKLIKRHGKVLFTDKYINEISNINKDISSIISILKSVNKITYQNTKDIVSLIKKMADNYKMEFIISSDSKEHNKKLENHLDDKFKDLQTHKDILQKLWVSVSWEWRYFKKDLDSDLEKLLW